MAKGKSNLKEKDPFDVPFGGTIKEFADLIAPVVRHNFIGDQRGKWILGQVLYVKQTRKGPVITNAAF